MLEENDLGVDRLVLGGFSQGAVMAYALGLAAQRERPAAILAFSGFIPRVDGFDFDVESRAGLPVSISHGSLDPSSASSSRAKRGHGSNPPASRSATAKTLCRTRSLRAPSLKPGCSRESFGLGDRGVAGTRLFDAGLGRPDGYGAPVADEPLVEERRCAAAEQRAEVPDPPSAQKPSTSCGPNARAGFIAAPVRGPPKRMSSVIVNPIARPAMDLNVPRGSAADAKMTHTRKKVRIA